jgi:hypothetical protein
MFTWLKGISTVRTFWLALIAFFALPIPFALNLPSLVLQAATGYQGSLRWYAIDNTPGASPATDYAYLTTWGQAGRSAAVLGHLTFDLIFPPIYALFFAVSLTLIGEKLPRFAAFWRWLTLLPVIAFLSDYLENTGIIAMCLGYPAQWILGVASVTSIFTLLKFASFGLSILLMLIGAAVLLVRWLIHITRPRRLGADATKDGASL